MSYFLGILPVNGVNFWQLGAPAQHWGATWFNALQWVCSSYSISQNRSLTLWFLRCQQTSYLNLEMCLNSTVTVSFRTHGTSNSCAINWSKSSSALQDIYSAGCIHFIWQLIPGLPCMLIQHFTLHSMNSSAVQPHIQLGHKTFFIRFTTITLTSTNGITNTLHIHYWRPHSPCINWLS